MTNRSPPVAAWHTGSSEDERTFRDIKVLVPVNRVIDCILKVRVKADESGDGVRIVEEVSGAVAEFTLDAYISAVTHFLSPRNYMTNGGDAAAIAIGCSGVCLETDY